MDLEWPTSGESCTPFSATPRLVPAIALRSNSVSGVSPEGVPAATAEAEAGGGVTA